MKNIITVLFALTIYTLSNGQDQRIPYKSGEIQFFDFGNLTIEGYDGNEIIIESQSAYSNDDMTNTRGLKLISSKEEKTSPELAFKVNRDGIEITGASPWKSYLIKVPSKANISLKSDDPHYSLVNWDYLIRDIDGEVLVYVMELVDVHLKNVNGPASILTHGNIVYENNSTPNDNPISLDTYRGSVNVLVPGNSSFSVNLAAKAGNIYSAFNITKQSNKGEYILGLIKEGKTALKINAEAGGNIYIRKK